jgi:hypothetical protein
VGTCFFLRDFLCISQQGEFKNTTKNFSGKSMPKTFAEKVEKKILSICFLSRFALLAVSLHEEPKNTTKTFS